MDAQLHQLAEKLADGAGRLNQEIDLPEEAARPRRQNGRRQNGNQLKTPRRGIVCGRYRHGSDARVSDLRLCGLWLKGAGFDIGQKYEVEVREGQLTIRAVARHPPRRNTVAGKGAGVSRRD